VIRLPLPALRAFAVLVSATLLAVLPACSRPPVAHPADSLPALSPLPAELVAALDGYRAEGPKGWAFTQTTSGGGKERVERYDPRKRGAARWTLLSDKGAAPSDEEQKRYRDTRPNFDSAANLAAQLDRASAVLAAEDETSRTYQFRLIPGGENDHAAPHMRARFTLDRASGAISRVELFATGPFKPASSLTIEEAHTTLLYSLPAGDTPALPREVTMHVRGKRFWIRPFEEKVVSTFSDHENAAAAPTP
jgi:hypothetical protein